MNVLITGASGFIGSHLRKILSLEKIKVFPTSHKPRNGFITLDLSDFKKCQSMLEYHKIDVAINLAWHTSTLNYSNMLENFDALNWNKNLFEILANSNIKSVISLGSSAELAEYPNPEGSINIDSTIYSRTKYEAFKNFNETFSKTDKKYKWLRLFQVYGEGQPSYRLIPTLINHVLNKTTFHLSNPKSARDWINVDDVAVAISKILEEDQDSLIDLGTCAGITNEDICVFLEKNFQLKWEVAHNANNQITSLIASEEKSIKKYYEPKINLYNYLEEKCHEKT